VSLYLVETVFHLAAAVDSDALHHGEAAPAAAAGRYPASRQP
jgi:hypothetical protein